MNRREAREYVMAKAFEIDANHDWEAASWKYLDEEELGKQKSYAENILTKLLEDRDNIDGIINRVSDGWTTGRMAKADLAIIRVAACEILYQEDVPKAVAINEAVELTKIYCSEEAPRFVNGVLAKLAK